MRVVVLMSTYQGAEFVAEQVKSILLQLPPQGRLMVRDDGSRDSTVDIVRTFDDPRISLVCGPNVGFSKSFFSLMAEAPSDAEMIMFSDQDDVWLPHKIARAWDHIAASAGGPALYCARQQLVDRTLTPLALSNIWPRPASLENALTENVVTGCTAAFNREALVLALKLRAPQEIYFHDWWLYLVVSAFGNVIIDPEATILYRQHGKNAVGRGDGLGRYIGILRFIRKQSWVHIMYRQIGEFSAVFSEQLTSSQRQLITDYFNPHRPISLLKLLFTPKRFRQTLLGDVLFRLLLMVEVASGRGLLPVKTSRT